ncbi:uncharacterized protein K452DRAFT_110620 [Aplosporella prunicola CBS 121167]|uniref:Xylanolytic transcriptional activator regulatory domain-containing protein n=1 Tax=Aplosporella prunicola CBS 121167 TaxID=1176127 RepID=A0A6A6B311_9PEZI|nr:uncharacterized protein K452DRAFT_110620 [Aplosporella prunicola CBS 121167]KAF2137397.1 hypothetical protein K452DRAFT_110620 [Aplosporella prunicola CBS 121167]
MQRCKSLAKAIKSRRAPPWPSSPTKDLPGREVADELVDCYLRTVETVHRILHIPSFRRDYEALWTPASEPDMAFLVQLKLVFAIGATTYDEQFSLRTSAIRWVYEAQTWISEPEFKARLGIQFLQINVLLLLARELVGVGGDSVWVSAGALLRRAVSMGLHRDPAHLPKSTIFATEMRRRLWNTILEVVLQSSLTSGGPPLVSLDDFDAQPPRNLDDEQLVADNPVPKPASQFTQATVAIALRATFPLRLAVTKFLNDLSAHGTYEETLRLDAQLRAAYRALRRSLRGGHGSNTGLAPSAFALRAVDFLINRYLSALHVPFFALAALEPAYAFSRAVVLEASLKIWCAACPASTALPTQPRSNSESESASNSDITASLHDALPRLVACGSGYYRTAAMQAALLVAIELKTALEEEDEGLGPVRLRPDLLAVLADAEAWCLRCVEIGETNVKGYVLVCVVTALIRGLSARLGRNEIHALLVKAMRNAAAACVPLLEGMAARGWGEESVGEAQQMALGETSVLDDWDKLMADSLFEPEGLEPMNWIFGETPQGTAAW